MFNKLLCPCDDLKLFCEPAITRSLAHSLRLVSATTGNPPLRLNIMISIISLLHCESQVLMTHCKTL